MDVSEVTQLLADLAGGNRQAFDALMPLVYGDLRQIARRQLASERAGHTLDSVALVNEAYAKLSKQQQLSPQNRAHFFGAASGAMRRILVDDARGRRAAKRGAGVAPLPLEGLSAVLSDEGAEDLLDLHDALNRLSEIDEQAGRVVECLYFASMTYEEIAVLFEAEQRGPVQRKVALKLIKWGMDTKEVIARFDSERQALALMNHPNIAGIYDAGATEQGRPCFAMEYVQGIPVTEYCDKHRLTIRERLQLFIEICPDLRGRPARPPERDHP